MVFNCDCDCEVEYPTGMESIVGEWIVMQVLILAEPPKIRGIQMDTEGSLWQKVWSILVHMVMIRRFLPNIMRAIQGLFPSLEYLSS